MLQMLLAILFSTGAWATRSEFSPSIQGDIASVDSELQQWNSSYFNVRLMQKVTGDTWWCAVTLKAIQIQARISNEEYASDSYALPDKTLCAVKGSGYRWSIGYLSPEWAQSLGVASADMFAAYDYRYSAFVEDTFRIYNPGILFEKFYENSSWAIYAGVGQFKSKIQIGPSVVPEIINMNSEFGVAYFTTINEKDFSLAVVQVSDRDGYFAINPDTLQMERRFAPYTIANLGISAAAWGGTVFRGDFSKIFNRTYSSEMFVGIESSPSLLVVGIETPTILRSIFSIQYSSLGMTDNKEILKYSGSEWVLFSIRTDLSKSKFMDIQWLNYHYDGSHVFKWQFTWPNKRQTELAIGLETYYSPQNGYFEKGFDNMSRVFFRYNINASL